MINSDIDSVVVKAIEDLADMFPETIQAIVKEGHFISRVQDQSGNSATLVDFTRGMTYSNEEFIYHTQYLYNEFCQYPKWYIV